MKTVVKSILTPMGLASLSVGLFAQTYNISTVTGSYNLDSNSTASPLNAPQAVAVDSAGVVYFTDTLGNRVRKYDPVTTKVTTIAGDGTIGSAAGATFGGVAQTAGAGGPAVKAKLWQPKGVALDSN